MQTEGQRSGKLNQLTFIKFSVINRELISQTTVAANQRWTLGNQASRSHKRGGFGCKFNPIVLSRFG